MAEEKQKYSLISLDTGEEPDQEEALTHISDEPEDEESVPYRRMQSVIVLCLIVLIAVFLVYFNFFR